MQLLHSKQHTPVRSIRESLLRLLLSERGLFRFSCWGVPILPSRRHAHDRTQKAARPLASLSGILLRQSSLENRMSGSFFKPVSFICGSERPSAHSCVSAKMKKVGFVRSWLNRFSWSPMNRKKWKHPHRERIEPGTKL